MNEICFIFIIFCIFSKSGFKILIFCFVGSEACFKQVLKPSFPRPKDDIIKRPIVEVSDFEGRFDAKVFVDWINSLEDTIWKILNALPSSR